MSRASRLDAPRVSATTMRRVDALLGIGCLAAAVLLVAVAVMAYQKTFVASTDIQLRAGAIGNALQKGSDVKLHGVPVGQVTSVRAVDDGASLTLALDPGTAARLPAATVARILPKTLFGERYVALVTDGVGGATLRSGATIHEDTSHEAVELQQLFDQLLPLLRSIRPDKLAATMGELATTLRGRGDDIGDAMARWGAYLQKLNPSVPTMTEDLAKLASVAETYDDAAPELLSALDSLTTTSATVVDQRGELRDAFANVNTAADTAHGWIADNEDTIVILAKQSRAALDVIRPYASEFPGLFAATRAFIPVMDRTLGKGTAEPGVHVRMQVVAPRGKYVAGTDAPTYESGKAPRCPYVTGEAGTRPAPAETAGSDRAPRVIPPPPSAPLQHQYAEARGLGRANSPAENQLIAELVAPSVSMSPTDYPAWGSLLVGPLLRNAAVSLR